MIHHVYANRSNIGDWLSARGIQILLGLPVSEHFCDEPFVAATLDQLSCLNEDDLIVIGGGGLFMDYFTPFWEGFWPIAQKVPFFIWGVGFVDLKQEPSRPSVELLSGIIEQSRGCWVRDQHTREVLGDLSLPEPIPCPSFAAIGSELQPEPAVLHSANLTTVGQAAYDEMRGVAEFFAASSGRIFRETNNRIPNPSEEALQRVVDLYARSDVILSSRLHGCVIALSLNRKIVAVSGDHKIDSFMKEAGLEDWCLNFDQLDEVLPTLKSISSQAAVPEFVGRVRGLNQRIAEIVRPREKR